MLSPTRACILPVCSFCCPTTPDPCHVARRSLNRLISRVGSVADRTVVPGAHDTRGKAKQRGRSVTFVTFRALWKSFWGCLGRRPAASTRRAPRARRSRPSVIDQRLGFHLDRVTRRAGHLNGGVLNHTGRAELFVQKRGKETCR